MLNKNYNPYYLNSLLFHMDLIIGYLAFELKLDQNKCVV